MMIVTFCGHSELSGESEIKTWLEQVLRQLIAQGATTFYLGGYGAFDRMAARVLTELKAEHPNIERTLVLAYHNIKMDKNLYDNSYYPSLETTPRRYAIVKRNEKMVDEADIVVAYVVYGWGGAAKTLEFAERKGKEVVMYQEI